MKTLLIYAHPKTKGHCTAILAEVEKVLQSINVQYELVDLYKVKYDPVLHEKEHYTAGGRHISEQNKEYQKKIHDAKRIIFIYPIWWYTMPAMMKGFFDRVLTARFAFRYTPQGIPIKMLKGRKAIVFLTSGAPAFFYPLFLGNRPAKIVKNTLEFCGIKTKTYQIGNCKEFNEKQQKKVKKIVSKGLEKMFGDII